MQILHMGGRDLSASALSATPQDVHLQEAKPGAEPGSTPGASDLGGIFTTRIYGYPA